MLGWRGIRRDLTETEHLRLEIRAFKKLHEMGLTNVGIMLPMVQHVRELKAAKAIMREEGLNLEKIELGIMVETPGAALTIEEFIEEGLNFVSFGTNDLTQYTLALDRGNARLAERFSAFHPAVLRMLRQARQVAAARGTPIAVCGEMASEPLGVFLLLGLGYREFSSAPTAVPLVRWLVRRLSTADAERAAAEALEAAVASDVLAVVERHLAACVDLDMVDAGWLPTRRGPASLNQRRS
jgi:pyruvate,water dikinase